MQTQRAASNNNNKRERQQQQQQIQQIPFATDKIKKMPTLGKKQQIHKQIGKQDKAQGEWGKEGTVN